MARLSPVRIPTFWKDLKRSVAIAMMEPLYCEQAIYELQERNGMEMGAHCLKAELIEHDTNDVKRNVFPGAIARQQPTRPLFG